MARIATALLVCALCATFAAGLENSRRLLQAPTPGPNYAPAPQVSVNGVQGYSCPMPGTSGYRFQPDPCRFGPFAGTLTYCDPDSEGNGYVGIRNESAARCVSTSDCKTGEFCAASVTPFRCYAAATSACFAGSLAPTPAPARG